VRRPSPPTTAPRSSDATDAVARALDAALSRAAATPRRGVLSWGRGHRVLLAMVIPPRFTKNQGFRPLVSDTGPRTQVRHDVSQHDRFRRPGEARSTRPPRPPRLVMDTASAVPPEFPTPRRTRIRPDRELDLASSPRPAMRRRPRCAGRGAFSRPRRPPSATYAASPPCSRPPRSRQAGGRLAVAASG
jgi:hypothetical protein